MKRFVVLICLIFILVAALYERPVPEVTATTPKISVPKSRPIVLPWPATGQAAFGAKGYGLLDSHGVNTPVPIASVAKVITALAVLQKKPVPVNGQGPIITLTQSDVDLFNKYFLNDGSVAQVQAGEQITEYQALEAMLLPSSNNLADTLAIWAFGSVDAYVTYANNMTKLLGLTQTTVGDATGFNDTTLSTASDMVKLGIAAISNQTIAAIAKEPTAAIPVAGTVNNINWLLGQDGVVGIKTGNTDKAGGCYLVAAQRQILGKQVTEVAAVLGNPDLNDAIHQADTIIKASDSGFENTTPVQKDQIVGTYNALWGAKAQLKSTKQLTLLSWKGQAVDITSSPQPIHAPSKAATKTGTITATSGRQTISSPLVLNNNLAGPSIWWRITHR